jgi:outer membrane protein
MKKSVLFIALMLVVGLTVKAQTFALIDMEYILESIPAYEQANQQVGQASQEWQKEVETLTQQAQSLYKDYQTKATSLSEAQRTKQEEEIVAKEKSVVELRRKYFGSEGELAKIREKLMKPIQDEIYDAVKELSELKGYSIVVDRASANSIIFASPRIDISDEVLTRLGYSD